MSKGNKTCNINAVVPILFGFEQIYVQVLYSAHHKIDFKSDYFCQNEGGKCFQIQSSAWNTLFPSDFHLRRFSAGCSRRKRKHLIISSLNNYYSETLITFSCLTKQHFSVYSMQDVHSRESILYNLTEDVQVYP